MIRRILVAVDDSARAPHVFAVALEIARAFGAAVRLYHAFTVPQEFPPAAATGKGDQLPGQLREEAEKRLGALMAGAQSVTCEVLVEEHSTAWRAIIHAAEQYDASLIVIGSHGYHGMDRLLGTNAGRVANSATRNVLVVHDAPAVVE
jgi:nucleotide-binding universal stress UspA family protein